MLALLPHAVAAGISIGEFWESTPKEICAITQRHYENDLMSFKRQLSAYHGLAYMIGNAFNGKLPSLYDVYPKLFEEESKQAALMRFKTAMLEYADANNRKRAASAGGE